MTRQRRELTFKHNRNRGRHGWLRLTPAYSLKVVHDLLDRQPGVYYVLDPFSGTGTTGVVCGERGIRCDLLEINPFLVWFARAKTATYTPEQLDNAVHIATQVAQLVVTTPDTDLWYPPIHNIDRWWTPARRQVLAAIHHHLMEIAPSPGRDLLLVAFCRVMIEWSNATFNHQSMSFKDEAPTLFDDQEPQMIADHFVAVMHDIAASATDPLGGSVQVIGADSRQVPTPRGGRYDCVLTSPPYPNRVSYVRELRPYMYWLGYLEQAREAGELDWRAIGGTWGIATSRLKDWHADGHAIDYPNFDAMLAEIAAQSDLLANYVHRYFVDMDAHLQTLLPALAPGASVHYVIGNSKFYNTLVPVEDIYAHLMQRHGFEDVSVDVLRKRNSKKELYEYLISARWG